jgi:small GTP-binding protein
MPINAHPEYLAAEKEYLTAQTLEEKIEKLKKMISVSPSHKGAENLRAELKTRLKKLTEKQEKNRKQGKGKAGIKKEGLQAVIVGKTKSGKSSLISSLTNISPKISDIPFTTKTPILGMMDYFGVNIQIVEIPSIESEYYDKGLVHTADLIILLVDKISDIQELTGKISDFNKKIIIAFNKIDLLNENEKRKLEARLKSQKINYVMISAQTGENLETLKNKIFQSFGKLRIFTKEPGKSKSEKPVIMNPNSTVKEIAEKIFKGFSKSVVETKIWGPSSKFPGQKVGLNHVLKDLDVVEFRTR